MSTIIMENSMENDIIMKNIIIREDSTMQVIVMAIIATNTIIIENKGTLLLHLSSWHQYVNREDHRRDIG